MSVLIKNPVARKHKKEKPIKKFQIKKPNFRLKIFLTLKVTKLFNL